MFQSKDHFLRSRIEPWIHEIMVQEIHKLGLKESVYIRKLIITDLRIRGALDDTTVAKQVLEGVY